MDVSTLAPLAGAFLLLWPTAAAVQSGASEAERLRAGHERMVALLAEIAARSDEENPFVGDAAVALLDARLEELEAGAPWQRRYAFLRQRAFHLLRLGRARESIANLEQAVALVEAQGSAAPAGLRAETQLGLGVALLRLGEDENCCAAPTPESCILPIQDGGLHARRAGSEGAMRAFLSVLEIGEPSHALALRARWLLNLAAMTIGEHPQGVPEEQRIALSVLGAGEGLPRFRNAAPALGLDSVSMAGGAVVDDLDGDGLLDVLTSDSNTRGPLRLFRNRGDGGFEERTREAGLEGLLGGLSIASADYDGDGDLDLLVLRGGWWGEGGRHPNSLLRNDGNGRFLDVTFHAGLGEAHLPTQAAAWADYDLDGDLDLYVGNECEAGTRVASQLFRNGGDGTFADVARAAGVENHAFAKAVAWGDYDGDGDPDLYVSNMGSANRLYRNDGKDGFVDVARPLGVDRPIAGFGCWFFDYDDDGSLDLAALAYGGPGGRMPDVADVAADYLGLPHGGETMRLYRGDGKGGFEDVTAALGLDDYRLAMGCNFGDLENDGDLDFYLGTGYPQYQGLMPNVMYANEGGRAFRDLSLAGGFAHLQKGHGVAFADLDDDGDLDVFEQMGGAYPGDAYGDVLYENPGFGHRWIKLRLVGTRSNRSGIGSRLTLHLGAGEGARVLHRWVGTGASFGCNPRRQEIGLGAHGRVRRLEVHWPASGQTQVFEDLAADRMYEITEGSDELVEVPLLPFALAGGN